MNVKFSLADLSELVIHDNGVSAKYIPDDGIKRKTILYRLHPLELLMDDESPDGYPVGLKLLELANQKTIDIVNYTYLKR